MLSTPQLPRRRARTAVALAIAGGLVFGALQPASVSFAATSPYLDKTLPASVRAADLVSRMTLTEKSQQLNAQTQTSGGSAPAIPRLGVKAYGYWNEALHGVARSGGSNLNQGGKATELPTGISLASSWNRDLVRQATDTVSTEARAFTNYTNSSVAVANKGLTYWSPTINMLRDPRWGRAEETYGEDPYLTGQIGGQFTSGMQGDPERNNGYLKTVVTPNHYLDNNSETNRHTADARRIAALSSGPTEASDPALDPGLSAGPPGPAEALWIDPVTPPQEPVPVEASRSGPSEDWSWLTADPDEVDEIDEADEVWVAPGAEPGPWKPAEPEAEVRPELPPPGSFDVATAADLADVFDVADVTSTEPPVTSTARRGSVPVFALLQVAGLVAVLIVLLVIVG